MRLVRPNEEVDVGAAVKRAEEDGWTVFYELHIGGYMGIARRGKIMLQAAGQSIVAAQWNVLQETHKFPIGDPEAA